MQLFPAPCDVHVLRYHRRGRAAELARASERPSLTGNAMAKLLALQMGHVFGKYLRTLKFVGRRVDEVASRPQRLSTAALSMLVT